MLYITWKDKKGNQPTVIWHLGEPLPVIDSPVVTFQADGDELVVLLHLLGEKDE